DERERRIWQDGPASGVPGAGRLVRGPPSADAVRRVLGEVRGHRRAEESAPPRFSVEIEPEVAAVPLVPDAGVEDARLGPRHSSSPPSPPSGRPVTHHGAPVVRYRRSAALPQPPPKRVHLLHRRVHGGPGLLIWV